MAVKFLLLLLITFLTVSICTPHQTHYVRPNSHTNCPTEGQQCQTLSFYVENKNQYFTSNTTMVFLPGIHQLSNVTLVIISDIENFVFLGSGDYDHTLEVWPGISKPAVEIYCREEAAFVFDNVSNLSIANITISDCGATVLPAALFVLSVLNLHMEGVVIRNSSGYGILGRNVLGNVSIYESTLILNGATGENNGCNMRFEYSLHSECSDDQDSLSLSIHSSRFLRGHSHNEAGMSLLFYGSCFTATVNITEVLFYGNGAVSGYGGNMFLAITNDVASDIKICICNSSFQYGEALYGAGMAFMITNQSSPREMCLVPTKVSLLILNIIFLSNHAGESGGGIKMFFQHTDSCHEVTVDIRDVTMDRNTAGKTGGGLDLVDYSDSRAKTSITVSGSSFTRGAAALGGGMAYTCYHNQDTKPNEYVSSMHTLRYLNITGLQFRNNSGGNMHVQLDVSHDNPGDIHIHIHNSTFQDGIAKYGGGMAIVISQSSLDQLCLAPIKVHLLIQNSTFLSNIALIDGGGLCMIFYPYPCYKVRADIRDVTMDRNTAWRGGGGLVVEDLYPRANISVTVSGGSITRGSASYGGGIVYIHSHDTDARSSAEFAASLQYSFRQFNVTGLQLHNNTAFRESGGNMYIQLELKNDSPADIQIYIYNCAYQYGEAYNGGGGIASVIYADESKNTACSTTNTKLLLHIESVNFLANHANDGGGLYFEFHHLCYHSKAVVTNNTFRSNTASLNGGAIAIKQLIEANSSHSDGVYVNVSVNRCSVSGGNATFGGGIFILSATQKSIWGTISDSEITNNTATSGGGGVFIKLVPWYDVSANISQESLHTCTSTGNISLYVLDTMIANNTAKSDLGGGLCIETHNPTCIPVNIHIADSTFSLNQAGYKGGNIAITEDIHALSSVITLQNCIVERGQAPDSGGMRILYTSLPLPPQCNCTSHAKRVVYINNTHFIGNVAQKFNAFGHVTFWTDTQDIDKDIFSQLPQKVIEFENCVFSGGSCLNQGCAAVVIVSFTNLFPEVGCIYEFRFQTSTFNSRYGSLIFLSTCKAVINDSQFIDNEYTAVQAVSSNIIFEGNTLFERNSAFNGGALSLLGGSIMFLKNNTSIMFKGNDAQHAGGAIYVNDFKSFKSTNTQCFFQPHMSRLDYIHRNPNISIFMENNTALIAGSSLYGGNVDSCLTYWRYTDLKSNIATDINSSQIFDSTFHLSPNKSDFSPIASDPTGVCICKDDIPQCDYRAFNGSGFPGALQVIPAVAVGERNGIVRDGVIVAVQLGESKVDDIQESVCTDKTLIRNTLCQHVLFRLHSPNGTRFFSFVPGNQEGTLYFESYLLFKVDILPCPVGFQLQQTQQEQYACTCDFILQRHGINCSIDGQTIQRPPESWVGINCTDLTDFCGVIVHNHCPFHYCRKEEMNLHLNDIDSQCNLNHSGVLCGGCQPGYSIVLGTSRCLQCSSKFLSLLLVFLIAGLALVFLFMLCNMTVSDGTINGLIFYANIVGINSATFFSTGQGNLFTSFLSVFIAWINLDLGIQTCLYDGMNMYQKTWLQFAFPLYIWAIVLFLITATHYSTLAAKVLVRRNAIKVLATLFLLSFAKLLHTTITALSFVILEYPDGNNKAVWLYDGNIDYLTGKHIPLFVVALFVFVLLMMPYTVVLTFSQCIQRKSNYPLLFWYTKFKLQPLFDAYAGPYKVRYRFWSGLLVTVRIILFLVFALNALGDPNVNLLAITTVSVLLVVSTTGLSIYKRWLMTIFESFLHCNLCLLSTSTLYIRSSGGSQAAVTGTLVGLVFASFSATLTCHAYQELKKTKLGVWICKKITAGRPQSQQDEPVVEDRPPAPRRAPVHHWDITLEDPVSGEATLIPISSSNHPQSTQSLTPQDISASTRARVYSKEAYQRHLQPRYCPPELSTPSLPPSLHSGTSDGPLKPGVVHVDTDPAPTDPHPSVTTTSDHTGTDSCSNTTLYQAQVASFIRHTSDDIPEYENYNELETIQLHNTEDNLHPSNPNTIDNTEEIPPYSGSSDYRDQILAFDSNSHNHFQFESENSNQVQVIHPNEGSNSDTSADEYQSLLQH